MKITVLNGSPKGEMSVTMQYVKFIQKNFSSHQMEILNISHDIKAIEKDDRAFQEIIEQVNSSDGVLWAFPLYFFLVPSQYKRFIELISEKGAEKAFKNKYTAVLTTSIHFFDHTAHNYMNAVCDDLNMKYTGCFSPEMNDLMKENERKNLLLFAGNFFEAIEKSMPTVKNYRPLIDVTLDYTPKDVTNKIDTGNKRIVLVTDALDEDTNLTKMIRQFGNLLKGEIEVVNLNDLDIKGGCLGCIQCGYDNKCVYTDKDGFIEFFNTKVKAADILIFAGKIKDRYLSSRWKLFFDRSFFNTHKPTLMGKQIGFMISGPLSQIPNLRQILQAYVESQPANLVDFITDEYENSSEIDGFLENFAGRLIKYSSNNYIKPSSFLAVGGAKIFRDEIWGKLRFVFQADHRFYKEHGYYDFPQKDYRTRITNGVMMFLTKFPAFRKEMVRRTKEEMIKPFRKLLNN